MRGRNALAGMVVASILAATGSAAAARQRPYSLSFEVAYGRNPARATYLDDLRRALGAWVAATGPLGAPSEKGEADLHLSLVFHEIVVERNYARTSGEVDVLFDRSEGRPGQTFSTLFEVHVSVVDPARDDATVVEKDLSVFNQQAYTKFITDPRQRSWDVNVDFLLDRLGAFLHKKRKKIQAHLRDNPREP